MVKKGKPKPHIAGGKKEKLLNAPTIALIALIIMVGSVIILPSTNGGGDEEQAAPQEQSFAQQILENAPPVKMPMNDTEVQALLNKSKPVARFFYAPADPASMQAGGVLAALSENSTLTVDRINALAQCAPEGPAEYIKQYCPKQAPLTILYLPNGQAFSYPGPIDKEKFVYYLSGNFTPTIGYYGLQFSNLPPTAYALVETLRGTAEEKILSRQEAMEAGAGTYPAAIVNRSDLNLQNYANMLNSFLTANIGNLRVYPVNDSIIISPNPHGLLTAECPNRTEVKFFFSPSSPSYGNESALLKNLQAQAPSVSIKEECLPLSKEDADTCLQKYNQTQEPIEEAKKYSLSSVPAYVVNADCQYEILIQKPFSGYGENASAEIRKQVCAFGNC